MNIKIEINPTPAILKAHGLDKNGAVQRFHTQKVMDRIQRYMPYRSGAMIKRMIAATNINNPLIIIPGPEVRMLYYGKVMVDPVTGAAGFLTKYGWRSRPDVPKVLSNRDINYTKTKNPLAGPYWDKRLLAAERDAMVADLERFIKTRGR